MGFMARINKKVGNAKRLPETLCVVSTVGFLVAIQFTSILAIYLSSLYGFWAIVSGVVIHKEEKARRKKQRDITSRCF